MSNFKSEFWDERFSSDDYIYGTEPNKFFKSQLDKISPKGKLILPGEGEGRNAVYAAKLGWQVDAFDQSINAQAEALKLAVQNKVNINYSIVNLEKIIPTKHYYNTAAVIFVHFSTEYRKVFHKKVIDSLKPGGQIILELFSKNQFGKSSGGPQDLAMLYSIDEIKNDFKEMRTILLKEESVLLDEGEKHRGEASVIQFVGEKI